MNIENINFVIGISGILIGIFFSYIFYRFSLREKEPSYILNSTNLIQDFTQRFADLDISYKGKPITNFTVTKISFWNDGKGTISGDDITNIDPLRITITKENIILDPKIIYSKNKANQIRIDLSEDRKNLFIHFDYLDHKDGCKIQLLHTGTDSSDITIKGTIKGVKRISPKKGSKIDTFSNRVISNIFEEIGPPIPRNIYRIFFGSILIITPILLFILLFLKPEFLLFGFDEKSPIISWSNLGALTIASLPYLVMGVLILIRRVPKEYEIYYDEL